MDAFEDLLRAARPAAARWINARVASRADAEDILQETCLAASRAFAQLRDRDAFLPWLLGIARKKYADWVRRRARCMEIPMDALPERAEEERGDAVLETLDALPERDRMMLRLFYQERLLQKEIADRLNIPEGTVKSRMNIARAHFRAAYPYPPKGVNVMKKASLPRTLPEYTAVPVDEPAFSVSCEELTGWFIVPRPGERLVWGMYDLPSRRLDIAYEMAVTGPASVHGLDGVAISARVIPPRVPVSPSDPMKDAVDASCGGTDEWTFIAQEKDGFTRFLSAEHMENGVRRLTTFLDGSAFMDNWGFGEDNRGTPVHRSPRGLIMRRGSAVTTARPGPAADIVGRYDLTLGGRLYETVCFMDLDMYEQGMISEQYLDRSGRTVLWRRFNRDDWALDRYKQRWSQLLPENERLTVNGVLYVHWYDCLCLR